MLNFRSMLKWARRAVLILVLLLFSISFFAVLSLDTGTLGAPGLRRVFSVYGGFSYVALHSAQEPTGPQSRTAKFAWLSDEDIRGISYRSGIDRRILGFQLMSRNYPARGAAAAFSVFGFGIPYWPLVLLLLLSELRGWMRRARAQAIKDAPQPRRAEPSTIVTDLPCVHCGYNLQTLATTGLCPECGSPIVDTLTLSAELARSRPGWLKSLVAGNILLLLTRLLLIAVAFQFIPSRGYSAADYTAVGICALGAAAFYLAGTFLLTLREHPFLSSPDRGSALRQRIGAVIVFACVAAAVYHQAYVLSGGPWSVELLPPLLMWSGAGFWHFPVLVLLLAGWLLYCACTVLEYRFLGKLAGRLLDRFMTEHCTIAGVGAGITNLLALWIVRDVVTGAFVGMDIAYFFVVAAIIILWVLFQIWTGFMNVYCAARFLQQAWMAEENWRAREMSPPLVQP